MLQNISVASLMVAGDEIADTSVGRLTHRGDICPYVRRTRLSDGNGHAATQEVWEVGDSVHRVLGYHPERFVAAGNFWTALLHRDDRELAARVMSATSTTDQHVFHYRLLDAAGEYRWIRDEFRVIRESGGAAVLSVGCWLDLGGQESLNNDELAGEFRELELLVDVLAARAQHRLSSTHNEHLQQNLHLSQLRIRKLQERLSPPDDYTLDGVTGAGVTDFGTLSTTDSMPSSKSSVDAWHTIRELTNALISVEKQSATDSHRVAVIVLAMRQTPRARAEPMPLAALNADSLGAQGVKIINAWQDIGQLIACVLLPSAQVLESLNLESVVTDPYVQASVSSVKVIDDDLRRQHHIDAATAALFKAQRQIAFDLWRQPNEPMPVDGVDANLSLHAQQTAALDSLGRATLDWEILLRIKGGNGSAQSPGDFIATATRYGLMCAIDDWVICATLSALHDEAIVERLPGMAINLSTQSWLNPSMPAILARHVDRSVLRPRQLSFEVPEPTMASGFAVVSEQIEQLRNAGFRVTLDDYGSGELSLNQLRDAELDAVKISGALIDGRDANPKLLGAVVGLARSLDLVTIGKHAQHKQSLQLLSRLGVHAVQGAAIGAPISFDDFLATLNRQ